MGPANSLKPVLQIGAAAATPVAVNATVPAWGPAVVEIFGGRIEILSMGMALFGLAMARGLAKSTDGKAKGGFYLSGALAVLVAAMVIEMEPPPGLATGIGLGAGLSGAIALNIIRDRFITALRGFSLAKLGKAWAILFGDERPKPDDASPSAPETGSKTE